MHGYGGHQVPWIAFIAVAIGFGIAMAFNVSSWINSRIVVVRKIIVARKLLWRDKQHACAYKHEYNTHM